MGARLAEEDSLGMRVRRRGDYTRVDFDRVAQGDLEGKELSRLRQAGTEATKVGELELEMSKEVREYVGPSEGKRRSQSEVPERM